MIASDTTLATALWPAGEGTLARNAALVVGGSLLLWLSAKVQVPFWPVPMTLQTLVVILVGAALGPRLGALVVLVYLAQGAAGLPVFAGTPEKGLGLAYMAGPTGGYLAGFLAAVVVVGMLAERGLDRSLAGMLATAAIGHLIILGCGWGWLALSVGAGKAWALGVQPFHAATLVKTGLAGLLVPAAWRMVEG